MASVPAMAAALVLAQASPDNAPLAQSARSVFETKCVQCHGSDLPHPRGNFGFIADLGRLVQSGTYVVAGDPEKSLVWQEIDEGDMPPDGAKAGPLSEDEKETVRRWILSLSQSVAPSSAERRPPPVVPGAAAPVSDTGSVDSGAATERWISSRVVVPLGRLHVLIVHFPIGLLLVAAIREIGAALRRRRWGGASAGWVSVGAAAAIAAGGLGWLHAATDGYPGWRGDPWTIAGLHRWVGTAAAVLSVPLLWSSLRDARAGGRSRVTTILLVIVACFVGFSGHFGGLLVHGADFLSP